MASNGWTVLLDVPQSCRKPNANIKLTSFYVKSSCPAVPTKAIARLKSDNSLSGTHAAMSPTACIHNRVLKREPESAWASSSSATRSTITAAGNSPSAGFALSSPSSGTGSLAFSSLAQPNVRHLLAQAPKPKNSNKRPQDIHLRSSRKKCPPSWPRTSQHPPSRPHAP